MINYIRRERRFINIHAHLHGYQTVDALFLYDPELFDSLAKMFHWWMLGEIIE